MYVGMYMTYVMFQRPTCNAANIKNWLNYTVRFLLSTGSQEAGNVSLLLFWSLLHPVYFVVNVEDLCLNRPL